MEDKVTQPIKTTSIENTAVKRTKKVEAVDPMKAKISLMYTRYKGNINAIAASLMVPKHIIEQYLKDENI